MRGCAVYQCWLQPPLGILGTNCPAQPASLIVSIVCQVWNQDLPHSRTQCGKYSFVASKNLSNREHCSKVSSDGLTSLIGDVAAEVRWGALSGTKDPSCK